MSSVGFPDWQSTVQIVGPPFLPTQDLVPPVSPTTIVAEQPMQSYRALMVLCVSQFTGLFVEIDCYDAPQAGLARTSRRHYVPVNSPVVFVLNVNAAAVSVRVFPDTPNQQITAGVWPTNAAEGAYRWLADLPALFQWPTVLIAPAGALNFDLAGYFGHARLTVVGLTQPAHAYLLQQDPALTLIGVAFAKAYAVGAYTSDEVYVPPGRTQLEIVNDGAANATFFASLVPILSSAPG